MDNHIGIYFYTNFLNLDLFLQLGQIFPQKFFSNFGKEEKFYSPDFLSLADWSIPLFLSPLSRENLETIEGKKVMIEMDKNQLSLLENKIFVVSKNGGIKEKRMEGIEENDFLILFPYILPTSFIQKIYFLNPEDSSNYLSILEGSEYINKDNYNFGIIENSNAENKISVGQFLDIKQRIPFAEPGININLLFDKYKGLFTTHFLGLKENIIKKFLEDCLQKFRSILFVEENRLSDILKNEPLLTIIKKIESIPSGSALRAETIWEELERDFLGEREKEGFCRIAKQFFTSEILYDQARNDFREKSKNEGILPFLGFVFVCLHKNYWEWDSLKERIKEILGENKEVENAALLLFSFLNGFSLLNKGIKQNSFFIDVSVLNAFSKKDHRFPRLEDPEGAKNDKGYREVKNTCLYFFKIVDSDFSTTDKKAAFYEELNDEFLKTDPNNSIFIFYLLKSRSEKIKKVVDLWGKI